MSAFDLSIIIDDYKFTLISKTVASSKGYYSINQQIVIIEDRNKVVITSEKNGSGEKKRFYAYTSVSQLGTWRLCIIDLKNNLIKFDNYIQATLIDIRLQNFINMNFDLLPYSESSDTFTRRLVANEINSIIKSGEQINDVFNYQEGVNPNGSISCWFNRDISSMINRRWVPIFSPFLIKMKDKSNFIESNYDLIRDSLKKILVFDIKLDVYKGNVEMYEITATKKKHIFNPIISENIVFQIGKFSLDLSVKGEKREGYYIFNMREPSTKINCYGLYTNYISGTGQNPYTNASIEEDNYISKPLNYTQQPLEDNQHQISKKLKKRDDALGPGLEEVKDDVVSLEDIGSQHYSFTAYKNNEIFPIKQIRGFLTEPVVSDSGVTASGVTASGVTASGVTRKPFFSWPFKQNVEETVNNDDYEDGPIDKETLKKMKSMFIGGRIRSKTKNKKHIKRKSRKSV